MLYNKAKLKIDKPRTDLKECEIIHQPKNDENFTSLHPLSLSIVCITTLVIIENWLFIDAIDCLAMVKILLNILFTKMNARSPKRIFF